MKIWSVFETYIFQKCVMREIMGMEFPLKNEYQILSCQSELK